MKLYDEQRHLLTTWPTTRDHDSQVGNVIVYTAQSRDTWQWAGPK